MAEQTDDSLIAFLEEEKANMAIQHAQEIANIKAEYEARSQNDAARVVQEVEKERNEQIQSLADQIAALTVAGLDKDATIATLTQTIAERDATIAELQNQNADQ